MYGFRKRIVTITFCDSYAKAVTRQNPAGRQAGQRRGETGTGGHAPGPFGIIGISLVRSGQRGAGPHPGRGARRRLTSRDGEQSQGSGVGGDVAEHRVQVRGFRHTGRSRGRLRRRATRHTSCPRTRTSAGGGAGSWRAGRRRRARGGWSCARACRAGPARWQGPAASADAALIWQATSLRLRPAKQGVPFGTATRAPPTVCRSKPLYRARKRRAVRSSREGRPGGQAGSGPVIGVRFSCRAGGGCGGPGVRRPG